MQIDEDENSNGAEGASPPANENQSQATEATAADPAQSPAKKGPVKKKVAKKKAAKPATAAKPPTASTAKDDASTTTEKGSKKAAAEFCGIDSSDVLSFRKDGKRYIVVTIAGQKLTESAQERDDRIDAEESAAAAAESN